MTQSASRRCKRLTYMSNGMDSTKRKNGPAYRIRSADGKSLLWTSDTPTTTLCGLYILLVGGICVVMRCSGRRGVRGGWQCLIHCNRGVSEMWIVAGVLANSWEREIGDVLSEDLRATRLFCLTVNNVHVKFIPFRGAVLTRRVIGPLQTLCMIMQPPSSWLLSVGLESDLEWRYHRHVPCRVPRV